MINPKYKHGTEVTITQGFNEGRKGIVTDFQEDSFLWFKWGPRFYVEWLPRNNFGRGEWVDERHLTTPKVPCLDPKATANLLQNYDNAIGEIARLRKHIDQMSCCCSGCTRHNANIKT